MDQAAKWMSLTGKKQRGRSRENVRLREVIGPTTTTAGGNDCRRVHSEEEGGLRTTDICGGGVLWRLAHSVRAPRQASARSLPQGACSCSVEQISIHQRRQAKSGAHYFPFSHSLICAASLSLSLLSRSKVGGSRLIGGHEGEELFEREDAIAVDIALEEGGLQVRFRVPQSTRQAR